MLPATALGHPALATPPRRAAGATFTDDIP